MFRLNIQAATTGRRLRRMIELFYRLHRHPDLSLNKFQKVFAKPD